jgi:signal transduction histidine kinase
MEPLQILADKKGLQICNEVPENLVALRYERVVRFIVRNLLVNAIKFTREGSVEIKASRHKDWLLLEITDTGIGMTKEQVKHFFNGEIVSTKGTQNEEGSGLGLILVNEFLQQVNGNLQVSSVAGKGSVMLLKIPIR